MLTLFFAVAAFDRLHVLLYPMHRQLISSEPRRGQESYQPSLYQKSNNYNLPMILISLSVFKLGTEIVNPPKLGENASNTA